MCVGYYFWLFCFWVGCGIRDDDYIALICPRCDQSGILAVCFHDIVCRKEMPCI